MSELLDRAQESLPGVDDRKEAMMRLVEMGAQCLTEAEERWEAMVEETAGSLTGVYPEDALRELREDWPE